MAAGGVRVTVADDNPDELAMIFATVEGVNVDANGCESASRLAEAGDPFAGLDRVDFVSVCAYRCVPSPRLDDVVLRFRGPDGDANALVRLDGCSGYYTGAKESASSLAPILPPGW